MSYSFLTFFILYLLIYINQCTYVYSTSEQEACKEKSLKQLITHCSISKPRVSNVLTVDRSNPGFGEQHISTRVSSSLRSISNYAKQIQSSHNHHQTIIYFS